jgi:AcrR family transcriptional regulator
MQKDKHNKTYVDILDRSMELFNDFGIESVSILRVAESLGISPGNLTYHFKRKKALLDTLVNRLEREIIVGLQEFPYRSDASLFVQAYAKLFAISWQHRGIFNSAPYLIQSGLVTASRFQLLSSHVITTMVRRTEPLVSQGFMQEIPAPYHLEMLMDCVWWQWLGWLRINQLRDPEQHISFTEIVKSAITHSIFLVRPYMRNNFPAKLNRAVMKLELSEQTISELEKPVQTTSPARKIRARKRIRLQS